MQYLTMRLLYAFFYVRLLLRRCAFVCAFYLLSVPLRYFFPCPPSRLLSGLLVARCSRCSHGTAIAQQRRWTQYVNISGDGEDRKSSGVGGLGGHPDESEQTEALARVRRELGGLE